MLTLRQGGVKSAGGELESADQEVVEEGNLITSRTPDDLPAFCAALLRQLK